MLPYQGGSIPPLGYTIVPAPVVPQQRVIYVPPPSIRPLPSYSLMDVDDEVDEYVPIRPKKRSQDIINEILDSSEMEEFTAHTRQIRKDAEAALQRLNTRKPSGRASDFFRNYDYDKRPLVQRYPSPLPERHLTRSPFLEEEDEPGTSFRSSLKSTSGLHPLSMTKDRIRSVFSDLEDSVSYKTPKSYDFSHPDYSSLRTARGSVQSEINRKAMLKEPSKSMGLGRSLSLRSPRERITRDAADVRSNIAIRAQYAALRDAATRDVSIRRPKDIMP